MRVSGFVSILKNAFRLSVVMTLLALSAISYAAEIKSYTIDDVPNPRLEDVSHHVSDPASMLTKESADYINEKLTELEKDTGIQSAVVMLPSIGDAGIFAFSQDLFRKWGIGQKDKNNGLLITYVGDQRKIRFHTGYGLEGYLSDADCKNIQLNDMIPYFKDDKIDNGMMEGVKAICQRLNLQGNPDNEGVPRSVLIALLTLVFAGFAFISIMIIRIIRYDPYAEKCPKCHKRVRFETVKSEKIQFGEKRYRVETERCPRCGYERTSKTRLRSHKKHNDDHYNSSSGSIGGSSDGSIGGDFGGGSSGGGGASSSW